MQLVQFMWFPSPCFVSCRISFRRRKPLTNAGDERGRALQRSNESLKRDAAGANAAEGDTKRWCCMRTAGESPTPHADERCFCRLCPVTKGTRTLQLTVSRFPCVRAARRQDKRGPPASRGDPRGSRNPTPGKQTRTARRPEPVFITHVKRLDLRRLIQTSLSHLKPPWWSCFARPVASNATVWKV